MKPVIDLVLHASGSSSALVLSGYTCVPCAVAGQAWLWIKRASCDEEESDGFTHSPTLSLTYSLTHSPNLSLTH